MVEDNSAAVAKEGSAPVAPKPKRRSDKARKADGQQQGKEGAPAAEKAESREVEDREVREASSVLTVIQRRLRTANKKIKKCEEIEQARRDGKEINEQQVGLGDGCCRAVLSGRLFGRERCIDFSRSSQQRLHSHAFSGPVAGCSIGASCAVCIGLRPRTSAHHRNAVLLH